MSSRLTPALFDFLSDLKRTNTTAWWAASKARYEEHVKAPMLAFIADLAPHMAKVSKHVRVEAKAVGGSLLRMNRDTRFSKDKSPYKTVVGARFMVAGAGDAMLGFCLFIEPERSRGYAGWWEPDGPALAAVRERIMSKPKEWSSAAGAPFRRRFEFDGESLNRPPRGVPEDHTHLDDLKRKSFAAFAPLTDKDVCDPGFVGAFADLCAQGAPMMRFLCDALKMKF